jgi:major type 1 subunit fimbrin (pilin)
MYLKKSLSAIALAAALGLVAQQAAASDGQITFIGEITDSTCQLAGGPGTDGAMGSPTVLLPTVSTSALPTAGSTAGDTPFQLIVTDDGGGQCIDGTKVSLHFDSAATPASGGFSAPMVDSATGRLNNLSGAGYAANVQVGLLDGGSNPIDLWTSNGAPQATVSGGQATLSYVAHYVASAAGVTPGNVSTAMMYTLQYN